RAAATIGGRVQTERFMASPSLRRAESALDDWRRHRRGVHRPPARQAPRLTPDVAEATTSPRLIGPAFDDDLADDRFPQRDPVIDAPLARLAFDFATVGGRV